MKNITLAIDLPVIPNADSPEGCVLWSLLKKDDVCRQHLPRSIRAKFINLLRLLRALGWPITQISNVYNEELYRLDITPWPPGFRWAINHFKNEGSSYWEGK